MRHLDFLDEDVIIILHEDGDIDAYFPDDGSPDTEKAPAHYITGGLVLAFLSRLDADEEFREEFGKYFHKEVTGEEEG